MRTFPHPKRKERLTVARNAKDHQRVSTAIFERDSQQPFNVNFIMLRTSLWFQVDANTCAPFTFSTDPYAETPQETVSSFVRI